MSVYILGICGTFMGGVALLARQQGINIQGADQNVYPPMSTQLESEGIQLHQGYDGCFTEPPELVVIGNAMSRGNPAVEQVLNKGWSYMSGPEWLAKTVLKDRWVIAVSGTHGKTTTSSMIAWILEYAGMSPGFLIGGIPKNFGVSARAGASQFFVVEADEYDTAFFDKRSKFIHYHPRTAVINNIEFDHADIFENLDAIKKQFHHFVRTIPGEGMVIANGQDVNVQSTLDMGCWTPVQKFNVNDQMTEGWSVSLRKDDGSHFEIFHDGISQGEVSWKLIGQHNVANALAAVAAAQHAGVPTGVAINALGEFAGVKRRLEVIGCVDGVTLYDDFAHHPTAIESTIAGLRKQVGSARILTLIEPRSNTMRMGVHQDALADSLRGSDEVIFYAPDELNWDPAKVLKEIENKTLVFKDIEEGVNLLDSRLQPGDHLLILSNGAFGGIHQKLLERLGKRTA